MQHVLSIRILLISVILKIPGKHWQL